MCSVSSCRLGSNLHFTILNPKLPNSQKTHCASLTKTNLLILDKKIIVVYSKNGKPYTLLTLCGRNADLFNINAFGV
jgi:hypothetical protein